MTPYHRRTNLILLLIEVFHLKGIIIDVGTSSGNARNTSLFF